MATLAGVMDERARRMFGPPQTMSPSNGLVRPPLQQRMADESVTSQFNKITAAGSPLITMGQAEGMKIANRRGLINSSIAEGTALAEGYKVALPLAQQEAQVAAARNLNASQIGSQERMQGKDIAAQRERLQISTDAEMARLERQLSTANEQQRKEIEAQMARLRETNTAEMARLEKQGEITGGLQGQQNAAEMARLQASLANANAQQRVDIQAQIDRLNQQAGIDTSARTQQGLIQGQLQTQQNLAEMDRLRTQIASAEGQQRVELQAQLDRLERQAAIDTAARTQQGQIQGGLQAQQNTAEMERLQASLTNATAQQKADILAQMDRLRFGTEAENIRQQRDIASREVMQSREFANLNAQQKADLASRMSLLVAELGSRASLQTQSLTAEQQRQAIQIQAQKAMQSAEFANLNAQQKTEIAAQMQRLVTSGQQSLAQISASGAQERQRIELQGKIETALQSSGAQQQRALASLQGDITSKLQTQQDAGQMQRLGAQMQHEIAVQANDTTAKLKQIAASGDQDVRKLVEAGLQERQSLAMNIAAGDRERVAASMVSIFNAEANLRAALLSNPQMPASERAGYERAIAGMGDPLRNFINQLFAPPPPPPPPPATPPPAGQAPPPPVSGGGLVQNPSLTPILPVTPLPRVVPQVTPRVASTTLQNSFGGGGLLGNELLRRQLV